MNTDRPLAALSVLCVVLVATAADGDPSPRVVRTETAASAETPDSPIATLEDIYGPSGESFQGAIGFRVFEGNATSGASQTSFGIAVDDMVVTWREYKLVEDQTSCATSGACASVVLDSSRVFEGNGLLGITVVDPTPYDPPTSNVNDCNGNGVFTDPVDTNDCDSNGITDVVVRVTSVAEPTGEIVALNRVGATNTYRGTLAVSAATNVPGVLFVQQLGTDAPVVTVRYNDRNDGTGQVCKNDPDPTKWGIVLATASIFMDTANVTIKSFRVVDVNGDQDGYPDTGETVDLFLTVSNKTNRNFTNIVATLSTADSKIECVLTSVSTLASLPGRGTAEMATPFRFKVHSTGVADRTSSGRTVNDDFAAAFAVTMSAAEFDTLVQPAQIFLDLDLNAQNPPAGATSTLVEGFEAAFGFGNFTFLNLDEGKAANSLSNGLRCQFNDPDFVNSNSYGDTECYVGFVAGQSPINAWHIHSTAMPDGGRAYLGAKSLHYGTHTPGNPNLDTTMLSQLDAIQSSSNVNLAARICQNDPAANKRHCNSAADCAVVGGGPCVSASPELSFKHQVSLADSRRTNTPAGHSVDRGVVHVRLGAATLWQKVYPFENVYDVQGTDVFSNCMFDPNDDGNDEDSYFDPTDPLRRLGPSSACFPEFVFGFQGDTDAPFAIGNIGRASDGPGLAGNLGIGTWVQAKFDLGRYRGRSVRVRFLFTSIKVSDLQTIQDAFMWNPTPDDDGWYIDDVRITQTLGSGVPTVSLDNATPPAAGCGDACTTMTAGLVASPAASPAPGQLVTLSAQSTSADRCVNGALLYQFWIDGDNNGMLGDPADTLLRDFTVNPIFLDAPSATTRYGVRVKCSAGGLGACAGATTTTTVGVTIPGFGVYSPHAWWTNVKTGPSPQTGGTSTIVVIEQDLATPPPNPAQARTGASVASAGNLNGDGLMDFIAGAPGYSVVGPNAGAAVVYLGSAVASERRSPDIIFRGEAPGDLAGTSVAGNFDFNNDTQPDLLIGAPGANDSAGKVYLIFFDRNDTTHYPNLANPNAQDTVSLNLVGKPGGIPGVVFEGSAGEQAGFSVAGGGRMNNNLSPDVAIGAPGNSSAGAVYVVFDPPSGETIQLANVAGSVAGIVYVGEAAGDRLGHSVAFPGDIMGTVGDELAMGAPFADPIDIPPPPEPPLETGHAFVDGGVVYVVQGGDLAAGIVSAAAIGRAVDGSRFQGDQDGAWVGYSIAGGGDNQADGARDFLIGAPRYSTPGPSPLLPGSVGFVFQTSATLSKGIIEVCAIGESPPGPGPGEDTILRHIPGVRWSGAAAGDQLGFAMSGLGDVNGDGLADIALGAPFADPGLSDAGRVYVIYGRTGLPSHRGEVNVGTVSGATPGVVISGTQAGERAGSSVAGIASFNGGLRDFVVGAPERTVGPDPAAGSVYEVLFDSVTTSTANRDAVFVFPAGVRVRTVRGHLASLRSTGNFGGEVCLGETTTGTLVDSTPPVPGGFYYLSKGVNPNDNTYRTFHFKENPTFPAKRDVQITVACP